MSTGEHYDLCYELDKSAQRIAEYGIYWEALFHKLTEEQSF